MTESGGGAAGMADLDETKRHGSVGRLMHDMEAKIVDPKTGEALPPGQQGELWLRGPTIMKGGAYLCKELFLSLFVIMIMHVKHFNYMEIDSGTIQRIYRTPILDCEAHDV